MKLSTVNYGKAYLARLKDFNVQLYKDRPVPDQQLLFKLDCAGDKQVQPSIISLDEGRVVGQIILLPIDFYWNNEIQKAVFACDYVVQPEYLNTGLGVRLLTKTIKENIHFGMGLSPISKKLHLALKEKMIGSVDKYLYIKSSFAYFHIACMTFLKFSLVKVPAKQDWPAEITDIGFGALRKDSFNGYDRAFNPGLIEFARDKQFLNWRFNKWFKGKYAFYEIADSKGEVAGYFVARAENWRGINVLVIADYRYNIKRDDVMDFICLAAKKLMKHNGLMGILMGSSLSVIDQKLSENSFKKVGVPSEIVTNLKLGDPDAEERNSNRNLIFANIADSDFEFNLGVNLWQLPVSKNSVT